MAELLSAAHKRLYEKCSEKRYGEVHLDGMMAGIDSCFKSSSGRLNRFKTIKACNERVCLAGASAGLGR